MSAEGRPEAAAPALEDKPGSMVLPPPAFGQEPMRQLTQAFGQSTSTQPLSADKITEAAAGEPQQAKSWGSTIFGHFEWTHKTMNEQSPQIPLVQETEDNPMRYKRRSRRVSLITSDGAVFQFDVPQSDNSLQTNADLMSPDHNNFIQVGGADTSMMQDPTVHRMDFVPPASAGDDDKAPPIGAMANRRNRRASLTEIVEQENIRAQTELTPEKLPIIVEQTITESLARPPEMSDRQMEPQNQDRSKKKSSVFDSWFFRGPEREQSESSDVTSSPSLSPGESPAESRKTSVANMEGIGGGQLTSKIVKALEIRSPSRKESRQMNVWMPQGM